MELHVGAPDRHLHTRFATLEASEPPQAVDTSTRFRRLHLALTLELDRRLTLGAAQVRRVLERAAARYRDELAGAGTAAPRPRRATGGSRPRVAGSGQSRHAHRIHAPRQWHGHDVTSLVIADGKNLKVERLAGIRQRVQRGRVDGRRYARLLKCIIAVLRVKLEAKNPPRLDMDRRA